MTKYSCMFLLLAVTSGFIAVAAESGVMEISMSQTGDTVNTVCKVTLNNNYARVVEVSRCQLVGHFPIPGQYSVCSSTYVTGCTQSSNARSNVGECSIQLKLAPDSFGRGYRFHCEMNLLTNFNEGYNTYSFSSPEVFFTASTVATQTANSSLIWIVVFMSILLIGSIALAYYYWKKRRRPAQESSNGRPRSDAVQSISGTTQMRQAGTSQREEHIVMSSIDRCSFCRIKINFGDRTERLNGCRHKMHLECYQYSLFFHLENCSAQPYHCPACVTTAVPTQAPNAQQNLCTICQDELQIGEHQVTLPCLCKFHLHCVKGHVSAGTGHVNHCSNCRRPFNAAIISDGLRTVGELKLINVGFGTFQCREYIK